MLPPSATELEITLYRHSAERYAVKLRHSSPSRDADVDPLSGQLAVAQFDFAALRALALDPSGYGRALSESLFADAAVASGFAEVRAEARGAPLRVRLLVGPSDPELQTLRWELLQDPDGDGPLFRGDWVHFSRYLTSGDWREVRQRSMDDLRSLIVVANPSDLGRVRDHGRPLAPIDVPGELERARTALAGVPPVELASGAAERPTWRALSSRLEEGFDVVYLVCHGTLVEDEPRLWLEAEDGTAGPVSGATLVQRVKDLLRPPHLVVLVSCRSAGEGWTASAEEAAAQRALMALGPRLAAAGVPAVLAMQGDVSMETMSTLLPAFFAELRRDGRIDRALAVARWSVAHRDDWWMPVLFMRLKSGQLWYAPGFADESNREKWPSVLNAIKQKRCVPIIGPGLQESLVGSRRDIALRWAETYGFPMAVHERDDLPQVAQFVAVQQDPGFMGDKLLEHLEQELRRLHPTVLDRVPEGTPLPDLVSLVGRARRESDPDEPHRILAELDLPLYVTTATGDLLLEALQAAGAAPQRLVCQSLIDPVYDEYADVGAEQAGAGAEASDALDEGQAAEDGSDAGPPVVFHAFGHLSDPDTLVVTEDDYFDFLLKVAGGWEKVPKSIRRKLVDGSLLFLGFQIDDWGLRTLLRLLKNQQGRGRRRRYEHVAVQIAPNEDQIQNPERARQYLERYFKGAKITVFWGSAEDLLKELRQRRQAEARAAREGVGDAAHRV